MNQMMVVIHQSRRMKTMGESVKYHQKQQNKQEQSEKQGSKMNELMQLCWQNEGGTKR